MGSPNCGRGYFTLFALALLPPVWHKYMTEQMKKWDEEMASEGERKIGAQMNQIAGYAS